jgi:hypothetical protein
MTARIQTSSLTIKDGHVIASVLSQKDQHLVTQFDQFLEIGSKVDLEPVIERVRARSGRLRVSSAMDATNMKLSEMAPDRRMF